MSTTELRPPSVLGAVVSTLGRDLTGLWQNPLAFAGGLAGTTLLVAVVAVLVNRQAATDDAADASETEELDIPFVPGALVKLGQKLDEKAIPEKIITRDTRAPDPGVEKGITDNDTQLPSPERKPEPDEPTKTSKLPDAVPKDKKLPTSDTPTERNTPFDEPPTLDTPIGDPFGSPNGWAERAEEGDPWATAVIAALNHGISGNAFAARTAAVNPVKFKITICKDGTISEVIQGASSGDAQLDYSVRQNVRNVTIPKPPPDIAQKLATKCKTIPYIFRWSPKTGVR